MFVAQAGKVLHSLKEGKTSTKKVPAVHSCSAKYAEAEQARSSYLVVYVYVMCQSILSACMSLCAGINPYYSYTRGVFIRGLSDLAFVLCCIDTGTRGVLEIERFRFISLHLGLTCSCSWCQQGLTRKKEGTYREMQ